MEYLRITFFQRGLVFMRTGPFQFYHQLRGTAIRTKCAPSCTILFLEDLKEKLLSGSSCKPWLWWRYIDEVFLIWTRRKEKLSEFVEYLNTAHNSIKFIAEWSKESVNFLDTKVIRKGNKLVTDLHTKQTDTHKTPAQFLLSSLSNQKGHPMRTGPSHNILYLIFFIFQFFREEDPSTSWLIYRGALHIKTYKN